MEACGGGAHADEVLHPRGAAEFPATRAEAANATGLLAGTDLLHLDAHVERLGQHFDELAEIHAPVGDVVENGFQSVALILHVTNLHLKSQVLGYLAAANHGVVLARLGFLIFLHIHGSCLAIDALDVIGILGRRALHL